MLLQLEQLDMVQQLNVTLSNNFTAMSEVFKIERDTNQIKFQEMSQEMKSVTDEKVALLSQKASLFSRVLSKSLEYLHIFSPWRRRWKRWKISI